MPTKSLVESKTFWGILISVASPIIAQALVDIVAQVLSLYATTANEAVGPTHWVVAALGGALGIYGRVNATSKVRMKI